MKYGTKDLAGSPQVLCGTDSGGLVFMGEGVPVAPELCDSPEAEAETREICAGRRAREEERALVPGRNQDRV